MSKPIISIEKVGKAYYLGRQIDHNQTFRDAIAHAVKAPFKRLREHAGPSKDSEDAFWALRDVSFEVKRGEVFGLIGRNGAGKSTLLKLLSRITEPTEGRAVLRGRVASLLEVGTGFHPELTGRENIFLNGSILGMSRIEIRKKFDQIVAFSEIEEFLDTPVKRYSSGMYVRLAFAVAAHLEPEILIVDEVLAVGDARFQKRCLGKMQEVASGQGRTVLFVSHNMQAVSTLTQRCVLMKKGRVVSVGPTADIINEYIHDGGSSPDMIYTAPASTESPKITRVELCTSEPHNVQSNGKPMQIMIEVNTPHPIEGARVALHACNRVGEPFMYFWAQDSQYEMCRKPGTYRLVCDIPNLRLYMGNYNFMVNLKEYAGGRQFDVIEGVCPFEVVMYGKEREGGWWKGACTYLEDGTWDVSRVA
ncbi:MAG TPA: polysaccharide ABC transporter ATP-binding protein [Tepidisphaeraceae bacterium]|jgi:lipopolysaccharide transport system ATP-binding protein